MKYNFIWTKEFKVWFGKETFKSQFQIRKRLSNIEIEGHFGIRKDVGSNIWELKWKDGRRIYYAHIEELDILLLLGGNKNGQNYDISQEKKIFRNYTENEI